MPSRNCNQSDLPSTKKQVEQVMSDLNITIDDIRIDSTKSIPDPIVLLYQEKNKKAPLMTEGNLSLVLGLSKSRKSFFVSAIVASLLGRPYLGMDCNGTYRICVFDTEQGINFCHVAKRRVLRMIGWDTDKNHERFDYYNLCEFYTKDRFNLIEYLIRTNGYDVAIIDGVVDICRDFNDQRESSEVVDRLMQIARQTKTHICSVLHLNKDAETARGHLGAFLIQKCETTFQIVKEDEYSIVKPDPKGCRHIEFEPFCFNIFEGLPHDFMPSIANAPEDKTREMLREIFALHSNKYIHMTDLVQELIAMSSNPQCQKSFKDKPLTKTTARRHINILTESGWLVKSSKGRKNVCFCMKRFSHPELLETTIEDVE